MPWHWPPDLKRPPWWHDSDHRMASLIWRNGYGFPSTISHNIYTASRPLNNVREMSGTRGFLCYWRVRLLTAIMLYPNAGGGLCRTPIHLDLYSLRSREISKTRDIGLHLSDRSKIWQAPRQQCCRCTCQISERYDHLTAQSRVFETSRDLVGG